MAFILPVGFDRADGVTNLPVQPMGSGGSGTIGTPTPAGSITIQAPNGQTSYVLQESVDSPEIERAEQATFTHRIGEITWATAVSLIGMLARGTFVQDSGQYGTSTIWRILSSKIKSLRGGKAELSYTAESISFDSPPDDFAMTPVQLGLDIIKYPRYFYALYPSGDDYTTLVGVAPTQTTRANVKMAIIRAIQTYRDSPYFPLAGKITTNGVVQNNIITTLLSEVIPVVTSSTSGSETAIDVSGDNGCLLAIAAAGEIIQKLWFQIDVPYIAGFQIKWSQYFFEPVYENPGGYIEDPVGVVPEYFLGWASGGPASGIITVLPQGDVTSSFGNLDTVAPLPANTLNIFSQMAAINPQCFSSSGTPSGNVNISWLRQADEVEYQRTWFKVTRTWIGSPVGHWDVQIYGGGVAANFGSPNRPSVPNDYLPLPTNAV
jgi:hypothetical protein